MEEEKVILPNQEFVDSYAANLYTPDYAPALEWLSPTESDKTRHISVETLQKYEVLRCSPLIKQPLAARPGKDLKL